MECDGRRSWLCVTSPGGMRAGAVTIPMVGALAHPGAMAPLPTSHAPGSMTVPPLFGWGDILTVLVLLLVVVAVFLIVASAGRASSRRSEFEAWLDGRSSRGRRPAADRRNPAD
jgi:hypothetical protein